MKFSDLQEGDSAKVVGFDESIAVCYRYKLLSMGLTPHTEFTLIRKAPLGDPIQIEVRGTSLILRKKEANLINILKIVTV